ncbi:hypothetical protein [Acrocarpospora catenulata]|uniref:hypothetical protein n=1 Tax=Acrocarpospora catenulata TaxID=2836182 RepID=UPI001BDAF940|nr:hypothetical protein [Acrocarpospora catenulata]
MPALVQALAPGRVLTLVGSSGTGRTTLAGAALARFHHERRARIAVFPRGIDPRRLRRTDLTDRSGYLIDAGDADWTRTVNEPVFRYLRHLAARSRCAFIVLMNERAHLTEVQRTSNVFTHVPPPAIQVSERCLAFGLRDQGSETADKDAGRLAQHERIREELANGTRPAEAHALAASILWRHRQGGALDEVVTEVCDERPERLRERARELLARRDEPDGRDRTHRQGKEPWIEDKAARESLHRRSFLLALAVLDGKPMVTVTSAALKLVEEVDAVRDDSTTPESTWSAFDESLAGWLTYAQAEDENHGDTPGTCPETTLMEAIERCRPRFQRVIEDKVREVARDFEPQHARHAETEANRQVQSVRVVQDDVQLECAAVVLVAREQPVVRRRPRFIPRITVSRRTVALVTGTLLVAVTGLGLRGAPDAPDSREIRAQAEAVGQVLGADQANMAGRETALGEELWNPIASAYGLRLRD